MMHLISEKLGWDVEVSGDMEVDDFDALRPTYLVQVSPAGRIQGCVRLLPTTGTTMLRDVFPALANPGRIPSVADVWESSRFALDAPPESAQAVNGLSGATYELFAGIIEFGLSRRLSSIVTVTNVRMERILRRANWLLQRIGSPRRIGTTVAVAGLVEISRATLDNMRRLGRLRGPVLWKPVLAAAA